MNHNAQNFPAISDPSAMARFPDARNAERDALLNSVSLCSGNIVLDIQAAGGYLSDGVYDRLDGEVTCLCVEPCPELRSRIADVHRIIADPIDNMCSITDDTADVALGLAGLHHSRSISATIAETYRILKPGGEFAVCDVTKDSAMAHWLNDFVDRNNRAGHKGLFLEPGEARTLMETAGFRDVEEFTRHVPWRFAGERQLVEFFRGLFGLTPGPDLVRSAIHRYLTVKQVGGEVWVEWYLNYSHGVKPH